MKSTVTSEVFVSGEGVFRVRRDRGVRRVIDTRPLEPPETRGLRMNLNPRSPFGLNRTTFTAAECRLRVARYSTLGGLKGFVASEPPAAAFSARTDAGMMFGYIIHS